MPRKYVRKVGAKPRATWTEEELVTAVEKVRAGEISKREAERRYNIPVRTLSRRIASGNIHKGALGPEGKLGSLLGKFCHSLVLYYSRGLGYRKREKTCCAH